ncbi:MAG: phosphoribosyl-ATP diphosphatase [Treponema sp.]|jgi:phosphoribosyl-ATP pyrophosphohydrolase/phosphoribosyl-AMP cyclohydrolase|nr:phosphoribosyl-ATP diphosphatase [Treponema sp.]
MVIASIDLQKGRVVQLRQGAELVLQRDNAPELAEEFGRYGEVAVIDLDAAMGAGSNFEMLRGLLRKAECRVGGGIRSPEQAKELISLGAVKVIVGSTAFRDPAVKGKFALNFPFLEEISGKIGRERLIIAVDAKKNPEGAYEIVVDGWKTPTGLDLFTAAAAVKPYAGELLFTGVDREGTMAGADLGGVKELRTALEGGPECKITAAGGVSTLEEVETLARLGCDVQLGMALYTGKIDLAEAFVRSLNWDKAAGGLLPVIAQSPDGQVLMTGFTDPEALRETFRRGNLCFHSRTRNRLWMKGESSGRILKIKRLRADCDRDAVLAVAEPAGPVCHTGAYSCFGVDRRYTWEYLGSVIAERFRSPRAGSYTATLDDELVREKVAEEAEELCGAAGHDDIVWEAADLLYFTTALMVRAGVTVEEVLAELERRHKK